MQVPSGRMFTTADLKLLEDLCKVGFIRWDDRPFKLKSGVFSHVYVQGRDDLTHNPSALWRLGRKILQVANECMQGDYRRPNFIGLPTAGTALAAAAALVDTVEDWTKRNACFSVMREVRKTHGTHQSWVVGSPEPEKFRYFAVDNVATDGQTKLDAHERFREDGYPVDELDYIIVVERGQGALERLWQKSIFRVHVVFYLLDITYAFGEMGWWPKGAVRRVEEEIKEHVLAA